MTFQWPLMLMSLLLLPVLAALYMLAQRRRRAYAVRFTNLALLREVAGDGPGLRRHIPPLLYMLGLAALLISLARPTAVIAVPRNQTSLMLVIDVSGSMAADDLQPSRMAASQQAATAFINALPEDAPVGVVSFNQTANVAAPLNRDHTDALRAIARLRAGGGTAIGDALNTALDYVQQRPTAADGQTPPTGIVLLSDGQSLTGGPPEEAATRARADGVTVYTVGIGQRGARVRIGNQMVGLDEQTLQAVAETTGGQYFYAADAGQLEQIYADLGTQVGWKEEKTEITAIVSALGTLFFVVGGLLALRWFQQFP